MADLINVTSLITSLVLAAATAVGGFLFAQVSKFNKEHKSLCGLPDKVDELKASVESRLDSQDDQIARLVRHDESDDEAIRELLFDRIKQAYRYHKCAGFCDLDEKQDMQRLYDEYHKKGGNGIADSAYQFVMSLPESKEE